MGSSLDTKLAGLESFLKEHPGITYATPSSANYSSLRATYALANTAVPLAIVRPQNANDVAAVVSYAIAAKIKFTVRSGGNSLFGLSQIQDALTIDMRDIDFVDVDTTKTSARVGGGVLLGKVAADLSKKDLATAVGTVPFVGYVGWCIYGGYGPFSANYGLGLDQIIGARVVNGKGELVVADEEMLKGIRGAGGNLGVIVELTIKVYPLKSVSSLSSPPADEEGLRQIDSCRHDIFRFQRYWCRYTGLSCCIPKTSCGRKTSGINDTTICCDRSSGKGFGCWLRVELR